MEVLNRQVTIAIVTAFIIGVGGVGYSGLIGSLKLLLQWIKEQRLWPLKLVSSKNIWREIMAMSRAQMRQQVSKPPSKNKMPKGLTYYRKGGKASAKSKVVKFVQREKFGQKRTFDTYPSAYANLAASKYCKDPNYAKKSKGGKRYKY